MVTFICPSTTNLKTGLKNGGRTLTVVGTIVGSIISAKNNGEFKIIKTENPILMFILGIMVVNFGLIIISCPTRLVLRFSFGDPFAFLGLIGLFGGIALGVVFLEWRAKS